MENQRMTHFPVFSCATLVLSFLLILGMIPLDSMSEARADSKPIVIKALSFMPRNLAAVSKFGDYVKAIKERSKGELEINWLGGPEIIKGGSQPDAVSTGAIDMVVMPLNFYADMVPETHAFFLSRHSPKEERDRGYYDYMVNLCKEKLNIYYLGRMAPERPFYIMSKFNISKPQIDLRGKKLGFDTATWDPMAKALGMVLVRIPVTDWYPALERGVVDAQGAPLTFITDMSFHKVVKYVIDYPLFPNNVVASMVNLTTWNKLPNHLRGLMSTTWAEMEPAFGAFQKKAVNDARQLGISKGMEFLQFSKDDAKWFVDTSYEAFWKEIKTKTSPETYTKLRKFLD